MLLLVDEKVAQRKAQHQKRPDGSGQEKEATQPSALLVQESDRLTLGIVENQTVDQAVHGGQCQEGHQRSDNNEGGEDVAEAPETLMSHGAVGPFQMDHVASDVAQLNIRAEAASGFCPGGNTGCRVESICHGQCLLKGSLSYLLVLEAVDGDLDRSSDWIVGRACSAIFEVVRDVTVN